MSGKKQKVHTLNVVYILQKQHEVASNENN